MQSRTDEFKLIRASVLIDGKGGLPMQEGAVLISGSKIVAVGPAREVAAPENAPVETFDYPGMTVMPA